MKNFANSTCHVHEPLAVRVATAARILDVDPVVIYRLTNCGALRLVNLDGVAVIPMEGILALIRQPGELA